ncbi:sialate O-acetylesterase [Bacteroidia bacterium]|nr:sialate O-acetylesterase [Bacteroidia bacterium]
MKKISLLIVAILETIGTYAQTGPSAYNYQRRSLFEILPTTTADIIFFGNSITDFCEWVELFNNPNIKNRGISGDRTYWMLDRLDPIIKGKPHKLFLLIGTNDIGYEAGNPQDVANNITKLVERFQAESPQTKLYIQSILPVNNDFELYAKRHGAKSAEIIEANNLLKNICAQKSITFIDVYSQLIDQNGKLNKEYTNDGLHLLGQGYLVWKGVLEEYIKN